MFFHISKFYCTKFIRQTTVLRRNSGRLFYKMTGLGFDWTFFQFETSSFRIALRSYFSYTPLADSAKNIFSCNEKVVVLKKHLSIVIFIA